MTIKRESPPFVATMNLDPRLLTWARWAGLALALTMVCGAAGGLLVVWQARQVARIINGVFLNGWDLAAAGPYFAILLPIIVLRALAALGVDVAANEAALRVKTQLRTIFARRLVDLGPGVLRQEKTAELTTTAIQGIENLDAYFSQYLPQVVLAGLIPLIILAAVFPRDALSALILALTAPLIPIFMLLIGKATEAITRRQWDLLARLGNYFLDSIQGLRELKQLGQSRQRGVQIESAAERHRAVTMQVLRVTFLSALALELVGTISTAVIAVQIGLRLLYGRMGFEEAFFILLLAPEFYQPLRLLGQRFHAALSGISAARRIFEVLDMPLPQIQLEPTVCVDLSAPFVIRFDDVRFGYPQQERPALDGLTFEIASGERVALIGVSGAGKSTIAQLLMRFLQPNKGNILINGVRLQQIDLECWRSQVAWVPQRPFLLLDTVANNIAPVAAERREERLMLAARRARFEQVIESLPQGIDSTVGERGARLSGGEAQRLALARAFYVDAPLLVLDEPTAYLDPLNESLLEESTSKLLQGKTALIIAHRLTTVVNADRILVIDNGRVVEQGNHQELLSKKGAYFELVQAFRGRS